MSIATFARESRDKIISLFFSLSQKTEFRKEKNKDFNLTTAMARQNQAAF
jgi:hypothetical protein